MMDIGSPLNEGPPVNWVKTFPSGSGAVRLFAGQGGDSCVISNAGSSAMFVWPPSGVAVLGTATNNAVSVAPNISCKFTCINATTWINEPATAGGLN